MFKIEFKYGSISSDKLSDLITNYIRNYAPKGCDISDAFEYSNISDAFEYSNMNSTHGRILTYGDEREGSFNPVTESTELSSSRADMWNQIFCYLSVRLVDDNTFLKLSNPRELSLDPVMKGEAVEIRVNFDAIYMGGVIDIRDSICLIPPFSEIKEVVELLEIWVCNIKMKILEEFRAKLIHNTTN